MEWTRHLKILIKAAEAQGWRVERRSKHYLFFPSDRAIRPIVVPSTPSSRRTPANKIAELKRAGLIWPPKDAAKPRRMNGPDNQ
jgi:hypothetical protein